MNEKISENEQKIEEMEQQLTESNQRYEQVCVELKERNEEKTSLIEEIERERSATAEYKSRFDDLENRHQEQVRKNITKYILMITI